MDIDTLLAEADPARDISIPVADWPAAARRALDQMTMPVPTPPRRRRQGSTRRLLAVAAASAVIATGLAITLVTASGTPPGNGTGPGSRGGSRPAGGSFGSANTAAGLLRNAALAALRSPARAPRPDQFVYTKMYTTDTTRSGGPGVIQQWTSVSGARFGLVKGGWRSPAGGWQISACINGRLKLAPGAPGGLAGGSHCVQAQIAGYLPNLPTGNPVALARYLNKKFQIHFLSPNDYASQLVSLVAQLTDHEYLTPAQHAALYNLLAQTPGLKVVHHVRNQLGSIGIGVRTRFLDKGLYDVIIFNPKTYASLGLIWRQPTGKKLAGISNGGEVLLKQAIVNTAGQLP
jgi:hypothetical protein